jgi:cyclic-di-GMP-binding protein
MALNLNLPVSTRTLAKDFETNPKKIKLWAESLPLTKTVEAGKKLHDFLENVNRAKFSADDRLAFIDTITPILCVVFEELESIYAYSSLPMPTRQLDAFQLARKLATECAYTYKLVLMERSGKLLKFNAKKNIGPNLYRAMYYASAQILQCYKTYHPVPQGVWAELHQLFGFAEDSDLVTEPVDFINENQRAAQSKTNIGEVYVDTCLISMADPYRLMFKEVDRVQEILGRNRAMVDFRNDSEGANPNELFVVALDGDQAPKPVIQGSRAAAGGTVLRILETKRLIERLKHRAQPGTASNSNASMAQSRATHDVSDLIQRLLRLWGDPPKRQFRRNAASATLALCSGIKGIAYFAERELEQSQSEDDSAVYEGGHTMPLLTIPQDEAAKQIGVDEWQVLNQSANGLRLHRKQGGTVAITVGEAVGVRFIGGRTWNMGVVRWLTLLENDALEFGLELVSPAATSVTIEATIGGGRPIPALLLAPPHTETESDEILTLPDTFSDLREFTINDHGREFTVRATTLMERTSRFDLFQFTPTNN